MIEQVRIAHYIADDVKAALMLPDSKGEVEMNTMFVGKEPAFCEWCADLSDQMWSGSKPLNTKELKVVDY